VTDLEEIPHTCCWHVDAQYSYTYWVGSQVVSHEVCCHCGERRTKTPPRPPIPAGHGRFYRHPTSPTYTLTARPAQPPYATCACNPANGGSGVCGCILGSDTITL
jgi:hypothetical protein